MKGKSGILSVRLVAFALSIYFFSACSKEATSVPEELANEYIIEKIEYFMQEGDAIDTTRIKLSEMFFENKSNALLEKEYNETFDELVKTSTFLVDSSNVTLPTELNLEQFDVLVPQEYFGENQFNYFKIRFPLSATIQKKPFENWQTTVQKVRIPAQSQIAITREMNRYDATLSFKATILDKKSRISYTVTGKWKGVLQYKGYRVTFNEFPLD